MTDEVALLKALDDWQHTSCRLESLDMYAVDHEDFLLGAYVRGEPMPPFEEGLQDWLVRLRQEQVDGKRRIRVHVIAGPLTPYLRYEIDWPYAACASAGEDIRILHRQGWSDTPFTSRPPDFYLLDDQTVALMAYDDAGHWLGGDIITDPVEVAQYRSIWNCALETAVPLRVYLGAMRQLPVPPPTTPLLSTPA